MSVLFFRNSAAARSLSAGIALAGLLSLSLPVPVFAQEETDELYAQWEEVSSLRARGEFDGAIEILGAILAAHPDDEEVARRAICHLIFTLFKKNDEDAARARAREALGRFPDLVVNTAELPPWMNDTFDGLRREMFGSLAITKPEGSLVFVDEDSVGTAPLVLEYLSAGEHGLRAEKAGYHDYSDVIRIDPNGKHSLELSMERRKDKRWWLYRVGPALVAGVLAAVALGGGSGGDAEPGPLPGPPAPPGG
ncbi:MAG: PEGA domain-containing protein [Candidatus Eisenbacteria bacterium]